MASIVVLRQIDLEYTITPCRHKENVVTCRKLRHVEEGGLPMAIITISREMGTGAYQIAKEVAKKLKFTLVDGQKIAEVAPKYGISAEILGKVDERPPAYITADDRLHAAYL